MMKKQGVLIFLWLLCQAYLANRFGVSEHLDSHRFIDYAYFLEHGEFSHLEEGRKADRDFWYVAYSAYLAFFNVLGLGKNWVIAGQVLISGLAAIGLYRTTQRISIKVNINEWAAFGACLFFIIWLRIQWWNYYIMTESLFVSFNLIFFYALLKFEKLSWKLLLLLPLLLFIFFIRPSGLLTVLAFLIYFIRQFLWSQKKMRSALLIIGSVLLIAFLFLINEMLSHYNIIIPLSRGEAICGVLNENLQQEDFNLPPESYTKLPRLFYFVFFNLIYFIKISFLKLLYFFGNIRLGFSLPHNALIMCFLLPVYSLAVYGLKRVPPSARFYILLFILLHCLLILITCVNWNGRFIAPVLPFIFILAGFGLARVVERVQSN